MEEKEKRKKRVFLRFSFKKMGEKVVYESSAINEQNKSDDKILPNTNFCRNVLGICRYKVVCVGILRFPTVVEDFMDFFKFSISILSSKKADRSSYRILINPNFV